MKKLIGFVVLLAAAGGGWWYYIKYGKPPEKATVNYAGRVAGRRFWRPSQSTGTLEPERRFDVGSQVSGTVMAIYADYNDIVKEGQLLAEIDPSLLQTQVEIRKAAIARQESDIANQKVQLEDQKKQLDRTRNLAEKGLQNQQQLEAAELAVKTRDAQIESAEEVARPGAGRPRAGRNERELHEDQGAGRRRGGGAPRGRGPDRAGQHDDAAVLRAREAAAEPALTALVDEADIGRIRPGMEVRFTVEAYGQQNFTGYVDAVRLNATVDNNVVTYPVWISVPNHDLQLRPSMTANLKIVLSTAENVIRVPNSATRFRPNAEIYKALGLEPPAPGSGGRLGGPNNDDARNNNGGGAAAATAGARPDRAGAQAVRAPIVSPASMTAGHAGRPRAATASRALRTARAADRAAIASRARRARTVRRAVRAAVSAHLAAAASGGSRLRQHDAGTAEGRDGRLPRPDGGGAGGGRGGGGRGGNQAQGGRGQGAGGRGQQPTPPSAAPARNTDKIDDLLGARGAGPTRLGRCGPGTRRPRS